MRNRIILYQDVNALLYSGVYDIKVLLGVKTTLSWLKILSNHTVGIEPTTSGMLALRSTD